MKHLILIILILVISSASKGNIDFQNLPADKDPKGYLIEIYPDIKNNVCLVRFNIPENSYVKITMRDDSNNRIETLAEGEMEQGVHCVYFKTNQLPVSKFVCRMEVYANENTSIIFSKEITLNNK